MDKERLKKRLDELSAGAEHLGALAKVHERATEKDLRDAANLMLYTVMDVGQLLNAQLPGCICRRSVAENYDYVIYDRECRHHGYLWRLETQLKESYAKKEKKLMDEVRMSLVRAVLSGAASCNPHGDDDDLVERAIGIADGTLDRLAREDM